MSIPYLRPNESVDQLVFRCTNASSFECSEEAMLWTRMGPARMPLREALPVSATLLVLFLTGVTGNLAVCLVVAKHRAMRTPTNYYLFSLAVSDLLLLLFGLPNDLSIYWHQYPYSLGIVFCKLRALISEASSYASVLTIVAFSLERYLAICRPLRLHSLVGLRRARRVLAALWPLALSAASPFAYYTTISYHDYPPGSGNVSLNSAFCGMLQMPSWYIWELSSLCFFLLPGIVIMCLYVRIGLRIRSQVRGRHSTLKGVNGSVHGEARRAHSKKTIVRMLVAVVIAFFVCWAPFHFQRLFYIYGVATPHYHVINHYLFTITGILYYVSATVNPILYNVMSRRYRKAFRETLCCGEVKDSKAKHYRENSSIRETSVNHFSEATHVVRVQSLSHKDSNRIEHRIYRGSSLYSTRGSKYYQHKIKWDTNGVEDKRKMLENSMQDKLSIDRSKKTRELHITFSEN